MGILFTIVILLNFVSHTANAGGSLQDYSDRMEVIEQQINLCCNPKSGKVDPIRTQIAERLMAQTGPASQLLIEVKQSAQKANSVLENADQEVANRNEPSLTLQRETAKSKIESAVKKLNASISSRAPASTSDSLREEVRKAYQSYQRVGQTTSTEGFKSDVKTLRESKVTELTHLAAIGERLTDARKKANAYYCKTDIGADACKSDETLRAETQWYDSYANHALAADKVFDPRVSKSATISASAAR